MQLLPSSHQLRETDSTAPRFVLEKLDIALQQLTAIGTEYDVKTGGLFLFLTQPAPVVSIQGIDIEMLLHLDKLRRVFAGGEAFFLGAAPMIVRTRL